MNLQTARLELNSVLTLTFDYSSILSTANLFQRELLTVNFLTKKTHV